MIVNDQLKLIYLAVPRTASRTITHALFMGLPGCVKYGHHRMHIPEEYSQSDYFIFASVRNPYERMVSHYLHRNRHHVKSVGHWTFCEYIEQLSRNRLHWWGLAADPPAVSWLESTGCSHVMRFESLTSDWAALPVWKNVHKIPKLRKRNSSSRAERDWRHFYTRELAHVVFEHQRADFEIYGYDPDSWKFKSKSDAA